MRETEAATPVLHLTDVVGARLLDGAGEEIGRVADVIVRLGDDDYPPVSGILATIARRRVWVPASEIATMQEGGVTLRRPKIDLRRFERRPQEILLKEDLLDRQVIDVDGVELVRANEIELARVDGWFRVVGIDIGLRGFSRRLLPRKLGRRIRPGGFLDWASIEPFTGHIPTLRLTAPHPKLARMHPADLADLVEAAGRVEGEEIIDAIGDDPARGADLLEELGPEHRTELVEQRTDAAVADLIAHMEPDDAADLIAALPDDRRPAIIDLLHPSLARRLRALTGYEPATAGGLMSPDFLCLHLQATREEALDRVTRSRLPHEALAYVFVMNDHHRLRAAVDLVDLLRAEPGTALGDITVRHSVHVGPDTDAAQIARLLSDYDLTAAPVVDAEERMIGVVTVDDVLHVILPRKPRTAFGARRE